MKLLVGLSFLVLCFAVYTVEAAATGSPANSSPEESDSGETKVSLAESIAKLTKDVGEVLIQARNVTEKISKKVVSKTADEISTIIKQIHDVIAAAAVFNDTFEKFFEGLNSKVAKAIEDLI